MGQAGRHSISSRSCNAGHRDDRHERLTGAGVQAWQLFRFCLRGLRRSEREAQRLEDVQDVEINPFLCDLTLSDPIDGDPCSAKTPSQLISLDFGVPQLDAHPA
jgi:hypothetical protein